MQESASGWRTLLADVGRRRKMGEIKKVPSREYLLWAREYAAGNRTLRFGQAFVNRFHPSVGEPISQLFYEGNNAKAEEIIIEHYVDWS